MKNKYVDKLNPMLKKDYYNLVNKCEVLRKYYASDYGVICFIDYYLCSLSDTIDSDYYMAVSELKEHYHNLWKMKLN